MKNRVLMFWVALLMIFGGTMVIMFATGKIGRVSDSSDSESVSITFPELVTTEEPTLEISPFELTDQLGRKFHSDQLKGKIWVGSIFFSRCPSTCRMQNAEVAKLQSEFGDDGVLFVSITCDPKNDDVVTLAKYARMFNANADQWFFLTGPYEIAERIGNKMFGITVQPETHSDRLVLINRAGKVHSTHRSMLSEGVKEIREEIQRLLDEQEAAESEPSGGSVHSPDSDGPDSDNADSDNADSDGPDSDNADSDDAEFVELAPANTASTSDSKDTLDPSIGNSDE